MRHLPLVMVVAAVCAAAGCTAVSPGPQPSGPPPRPLSGPAAAAGSAGHQDGGSRAAPAPPVHQELRTTRPKVQAPPEAKPADVRPAPRARVRPAAPNVRRHGPRPPRRPTPDRPGVAPLVPLRGGAADACRLGEAYGSWPGGSTQARICRRAYGG